MISYDFTAFLRSFTATYSPEWALRNQLQKAPWESFLPGRTRFTHLTFAYVETQALKKMNSCFKVLMVLIHDIHELESNKHSFR